MTDDTPPDPFASDDRIDLRGAATLFANFADKTEPPERHTPLPLPPVTSLRVAIVVDGLGSSSAGLLMRDVVRRLEADGFAVCVFCYRGPGTNTYDQCDVALSNLNTLVDYLDHYVGRYRKASCLLLVGFSKEPPGTAQGRFHVVRVLTGYHAEPTELPLIASLVVIRSQPDTLINDRAYTFSDLPLDERPIELSLPFPHMEIAQRPELVQAVSEAAAALCAGKAPSFSLRASGGS